MNPIEGEQEPGGPALRGVQKAIITVGTFVCVCVCVGTGVRTHPCTIETGDQAENGIVYGIENCFQKSRSVSPQMDWPRQDFYWKISSEFAVVEIKSRTGGGVGWLWGRGGPVRDPSVTFHREWQSRMHYDPCCVAGFSD